MNFVQIVVYNIIIIHSSIYEFSEFALAYRVSKAFSYSSSLFISSDLIIKWKIPYILFNLNREMSVSIHTHLYGNYYVCLFLDSKRLKNV